MKLNSKDSHSFIRNLIMLFLNKYVLISLLLLFVYVGSWMLCISKVDWHEGYERISFISNNPVKVYYYNRGYIINWLKALEEKLTPTSTSSPSSSFAPTPTFAPHEKWVNGENFAVYASRFYYPLELMALS